MEVGNILGWMDPNIISGTLYLSPLFSVTVVPHHRVKKKHICFFTVRSENLCSATFSSFAAHWSPSLPDFYGKKPDEPVQADAPTILDGSPEFPEPETWPRPTPYADADDGWCCDATPDDGSKPDEPSPMGSDPKLWSVSAAIDPMDPIDPIAEDMNWWPICAP